MKIKEYINAGKVLVVFENGHEVYSTWDRFNRGVIKNPMDTTICGVGKLGFGNYSTRIGGKFTKSYTVWVSMLNRCYNNSNRKAYEKVTVNEEWFVFQNFAKWHEENYYEIDGYSIELDKDILIYGNTEYSKDNCIYAPSRINSLLLNNSNPKGDLPIGVVYQKKSKKYKASCKTGNGTSKTIGTFSTPEEAFLAYKEFKEIYIKEMAEEFKGRIPIKLYQALMEYRIQ